MNLTAERLRELLHYDPDTGIFERLVSASRSPAGTEAGSINASGYVLIRVDGRRYSAHRLAWLYMKGVWPSGDVDHDDGRRSNNRWGNLRGADCQGNKANSKRARNNTSGFKGVSWCRQYKKWRAGIQVHGRSFNLGVFATPEAAHAAYVAAAIKHFGEFARAA